MSTQPVATSAHFSLMTLLGLLPMIGPVVSAIQQIHGDDVAGATKKQMAEEALGTAVGVAETALPGEKAAIDAAGTFVSSAIDNWVNFYKAAGWVHPVTPAVIAAVQATPTSQANSPKQQNL